MNRFELSLFGLRVSARGHAGIAAAILVTAMLLIYLALTL
jgi:hypothetical protein